MTTRSKITALLLLTACVAVVAHAQYTAPAMPAATMQQALSAVPVTMEVAREWGWNIVCSIATACAVFIAALWALVVAFVKPYFGGINSDLTALRVTSGAHAERFDAVKAQIEAVKTTVDDTRATAEARTLAVAELGRKADALDRKFETVVIEVTKLSGGLAKTDSTVKAYVGATPPAGYDPFRVHEVSRPPSSETSVRGPRRKS